MIYFHRNAKCAFGNCYYLFLTRTHLKTNQRVEKMKKILVLLITAIACFSCVLAQSPSSFKYQAVLRNIRGDIRANASATILIEIAKNQGNGAVIYSETHKVKTDNFGLIDLEIGKGTPITGNFSTINWGNGTYFVNISVDGVLMGTAQLHSVPYALYAEKAGNGFSGDYNDLVNKPYLFDGTWQGLFGKPAFATVATTGQYNDLLGKPVMFDGTWSSLTGKPTLALVATSGNYNDLINKPVLTGTVTNVTSTSPVVVTNGSTTPAISIPKASATVNGYLSSADWTTFNNKSSFNGAFASLTGKPTTIAGYGITDAVTLSGNQTITGIKSFTGTISVSNKNIKNVATPVNSLDAANKKYVDKFNTKIFVNGNNIVSTTLTLGDTVDVYTSYDGLWNSSIILPTPNSSNYFLAKRIGTTLLIRCRSTFSFIIKTTNTDLLEDMVLTEGQSAVFIFDGDRWLKNHVSINIPTVRTNPVSSITPANAISGGSLTGNGGSAIISKGICWSINPNPTISLNTKTIDGSSNDYFTSSITGLTINTTYYVRAYATNIVGTGYGPEISFNTSDRIPLNGLIAHYTFDGNANDVSGNGNNGVISGATLTTDRFGNSNSAYSFDGINDCITIPAPNSINFNQGVSFSVFAIVKFQTTSGPVINNDGTIGTYSGGAIFTKYGCPQYAGPDVISVSYQNDSRLEFGVREGPLNVNNAAAIQYLNTDLYDKYHCITAIRDGVNGEIRLYFDGQLVQTQPLAALGDIKASIAIWIGKSMACNPNHLNDYKFFKGVMDEIGVYNRVLSDQEISSLF